MKKIIFYMVMFASVASSRSVFAATVTFQITPADVHNGYIVEKVWTKDYAKPDVKISQVNYIASNGLSKQPKFLDPNEFEVRMGMERARPFAIIRIPTTSTLKMTLYRIPLTLAGYPQEQ